MENVNIYVVLNNKNNKFFQFLKDRDIGYDPENLERQKKDYNFEIGELNFSNLYTDSNEKSFLFSDVQFPNISLKQDDEEKSKIQGVFEGIFRTLVRSAKKYQAKIKHLFLLVSQSISSEILDELIKNENVKVLNFGKTYILNKCFMDSGFTLYGKNIPHEAINKFKDDVGNRYFFLCDNGMIPDWLKETKKIPSKYFDINQAELVSFSKYEEGKYNTYSFIQWIKGIEVFQEDYDSITYDGISIKDIFKVNAFSKETGFLRDVGNKDVIDTDIVYTTFKKVNGSGTIQKPKNIGANLFTYEDKGLKGKLVKEMRQYVYEGTSLYNTLKEKLEEITWVDDTPNSFQDDYKEQTSILRLIGKEERETYLSDLLAFVLVNSPKILKKFLSIKDIGSYSVYREEKNVDLLIRGENAIVIIENKINAGFNDGEAKTWDSFISKNDKDEKLIKEINDEDERIEGKVSQLSKYYNLARYYAKRDGVNIDNVLCVILCPKYKKADYDISKKEYKRGEQYSTKTYGDILKTIEEVGLSDFEIEEQEIARDFMRTIKQYSLDQNTFYMDRACGRFVNRIKERKKYMKTKIYESLNKSKGRAIRDLRLKEMDLCNSVFAPNVLFDAKNVDAANSDIEEWANENNINLITITENGYEIRNASAYVQIDFMSKAYLAPTKEQIKKLNQPNTVLFLKNLHKMEDKIYRRRLLDFMREFIVADDSKEEKHTFVKNMLFTAATIGEMDKNEFFELCTMDAKDAFQHVKIN